MGVKRPESQYIQMNMIKKAFTIIIEEGLQILRKLHRIQHLLNKICGLILILMKIFWII